jgi:hypothetical protein
MRSMVRTAAVAAVLAAAAVAGAAPANALVCKQHSHTASSSGKFEGLTAIKARAAWRYEVQQHEGVSWTLWRLAKFKTTKCSKAGTGGSWTCVARARPCKTGS